MFIVLEEAKSRSEAHPLYAYVQPQLSLGLKSPLPAPTYAQRGTSVLQTIFKEHFREFAENYQQKSAPTYGRFRLKRITEVAERFLSFGELQRITCSFCKAETAWQIG
jgi:hypothetical protein